MADMTTKHHVLISDAVIEGMEKALETFAKESPIDTNSYFATRFVTRKIVAALGDKLRYTHDKFDYNTFYDKCMLRADLVWKKFRPGS